MQSHVELFDKAIEKRVEVSNNLLQVFENNELTPGEIIFWYKAYV